MRRGSARLSRSAQFEDEDETRRALTWRPPRSSSYDLRCALQCSPLGLKGVLYVLGPGMTTFFFSISAWRLTLGTHTHGCCLLLSSHYKEALYFVTSFLLVVLLRPPRGRRVVSHLRLPALCLCVVWGVGRGPGPGPGGVRASSSYASTSGSGTTSVRIGRPGGRLAHHRRRRSRSVRPSRPSRPSSTSSAPLKGSPNPSVPCRLVAQQRRPALAWLPAVRPSLHRTGTPDVQAH